MPVLDVIAGEGVAQYVLLPGDDPGGNSQALPAAQPIRRADSAVLLPAVISEPAPQHGVQGDMAAAAGFAVAGTKGDDALLPIYVAPGETLNFCRAYAGPEHEPQGRHAGAVNRLSRGLQQGEQLLPGQGANLTFFHILPG